MGGLTWRVADSAEKLPRAEWDALAAANGAGLLSWGLLSAFEASGSMVPATGWRPAHFLLERDGRLAACAPLYIKTHSWGEFVFDFEWADAARGAGIPWYPKLVGMVPATPAPCWRLLVGGEEDELELTEAFLDAVLSFARSERLGGIHFLWLDPAAAVLKAALERRGWAAWVHQGFLWENRGWPDFAGMLAAFSKNMRRNVLRERGGLARGGIEASIVTGAEADPALHDLMGRLYQRTNALYGPWAARFLEPGFFRELGCRWPEGMVYSLARSDGRPFAAALLYRGGKALFGRYWGTEEDLDGLHFEICYYSPMEWAIREGLGRFDPGMGGEHKVRRGFRAVAAPSYHYPLDGRLRAAMARILPEVNEAEAGRIEALNRDLPFKRPAAETGG